MKRKDDSPVERRRRSQAKPVPKGKPSHDPLMMRSDSQSGLTVSVDKSCGCQKELQDEGCGSTRSARVGNSSKVRHHY